MMDPLPVNVEQVGDKVRIVCGAWVVICEADEAIDLGRRVREHGRAALRHADEIRRRRQQTHADYRRAERAVERLRHHPPPRPELPEYIG